jgi:hypothetical protein
MPLLITSNYPLMSDLPKVNMSTRFTFSMGLVFPWTNLPLLNVSD